MTTRLLFLFLLMALGCGTGRLPNWKSGVLTPAEQARAKPVSTSTQFLSQGAWDASPWQRPGDFFLFPIFIVIATDGTACLVSAADWAIVHEQDHYPCQTAWRMPRPVR